MPQNQEKITLSFIGTGHMATAMIEGLLKQNFPAHNIRATNKSLEKLAHLDSNIIKTTDNTAAIRDADVIVLAVKPQAMPSLLSTLEFPKNSLVISVSATSTLTQLNTWIGAKQAIIRCMPNMPAAIGQAATAAMANANVSPKQLAQAEWILQAIGLTVWLTNENLFDISTAIAGSAPAYYFYLLEILQNFAVKHGLPAEYAKRLAAQSCAGAGLLALQREESFAALKQQVMSPQGLTEAAIHSMETDNLPRIIDHALEELLKRASNLS